MKNLLLFRNIVTIFAAVFFLHQIVIVQIYAQVPMVTKSSSPSCSHIGDQCCDIGSTGSIPPSVFGRCDNGLTCNTSTLQCEGQQPLQCPAGTIKLCEGGICDCVADPRISPTPDWCQYTGRSGGCPISPIIQTVTPSSSCEKFLGDADCNGKVDLVDFELWRREFVGEVSTRVADFNQDGKIDILDFEVWRKGFSNTVGVITPIINPSSQ